MKNFTDTIGNRTRELPACSAVPQLTAPHRTPSTIGLSTFYSAVCDYSSPNSLVSIEILCLALSATNCSLEDVKNASGVRVKFHGY